MSKHCIFFFFQAEDGIRDDLVTGVQTCALPISNVHSCLDPREEPTRIRRFLLQVKITLRIRSKAKGNKNIFNPVNSRILPVEFSLVLQWLSTFTRRAGILAS